MIDYLRKEVSCSKTTTHCNRVLIESSHIESTEVKKFILNSNVRHQFIYLGKEQYCKSKNKNLF